MIPAAELAAIEARANAATPGPWRGDRNDGSVKYSVLGADNTEVLHVDHKNFESGFWSPERAEQDEAFVLHSRDDVPALCREVRLLQGAFAAQEARDLAAAQRAGLPPFGCDTSEVLADELLALRALLRECRDSLAAHRERDGLPSYGLAPLLRRLDAALEGGAK